MFKKTREKSPYFHLAVDFGYTLLASILVFGGLGWYADNRWGTTPWLMLAGGALGLAVGFNSLFRRLNLLEKKDRKAPRQKLPEGDPPDRQPR